MAFIRWFPSAGATLYDIYFGTAASPPLVVSDQVTAALGSVTVPGTLEYTVTLAAGTQYYWKIVAKNTDTSTTGDIWTFFTQPVIPPPDPGPDFPDPVKGTALLTLIANDASIRRDENLVAANSDYTCIFWLKPLALPPTSFGQNIFVLKNSDYSEYVEIFTGEDGLVHLNAVTLTQDETETDPFYVNVFNCIAYVRSGNNHSLYVNQVLAGTIVVDITGVTFTDAIIGFDDAASSVNNFEIAWFREWSSALTLAQLGHEWGSRQAIVTSGINCDTPLTDDLLDQSGLDNIWTATGSYGFTDKLVIIDPPVNNITQNTAYEIELNTTYVQDVLARFASSNQYVWFTYVAGVENYISIWGFNGIPNAGYIARVRPYQGTNTNWPDDVEPALNLPVQIPVFTGLRYDFRAEPNNFLAISTKLLLLNIIPQVPETVPNGAILVNDDTPDFGAAIISSVDSDDHHVYKFLVPFPAGEYGDVFANLESPIYVIADDFSNGEEGQIVIFDVNFNELSRFVFETSNDGHNIVRANQVAEVAYIANRNKAISPINATSVNSAGVQGVEFTIPSTGLSALVPNNDGTLLYLSGVPGPGLNNSNIKVWNITAGDFIADLVAIETNYQTRDLIMLADNTIIALYFKDSSTRQLTAKRYDTSGNLLNTYSLHTGNDLQSLSLVTVGYRLTSAIDDPDSFWVWYHLINVSTGVDRISRFENIRVSDGVVLASKDETEFNQGASQAAQGFDPERFGVSSSCPFIIVRTLGGGPIIPPTELLGGIYKIVPGKRNDTLWTDLTNNLTVDVEIPQPKFTSGLIP